MSTLTLEVLLCEVNICIDTFFAWQKGEKKRGKGEGEWEREEGNSCCTHTPTTDSAVSAVCL